MEEDEDFQSDENVETILDADSFEDQDTMLYNNPNEANSQYEFSQYSLDDDSLIIIDDEDEDDEDVDVNIDDNSSNSLSDSDENFKVRRKLNASTSLKIPARKMITTDEVDDDTEIEIFDQQVPIKRCAVPTIVNSSTDSNLSLRPVKNDFLNLEQIAIPKKMPYVSKLSPSVNPSQNKKPRSISVTSSTSLVKPTNTISRLQPTSSFSEIGYKKIFSKPNITPINESKSELYVLPHNSVKYVVKNNNSRELKSHPLKLCPSISSIVKTNNSVAESSKQKKKIILSSAKVLPSGDTNRIPKFVARMQKLPDGKYKMIPAEGKIPIGFEKLFKRNSHFIKQKMDSTPNEHSLSNFIHVVKPSMSPYQMTKHNETRNFNHNRQVLSGKSVQVDVSKTIDFGNVSKNNKLIPHTATSKDALENHRNFAGNGDLILKTNKDLSTSSGFIQVSSNSKSLVQSSNQPLSNTKYGWFILLTFFFIIITYFKL